MLRKSFVFWCLLLHLEFKLSHDPSYCCLYLSLPMLLEDRGNSPSAFYIMDCVHHSSLLALTLRNCIAIDLELSKHLFLALEHFALQGVVQCTADKLIQFPGLEPATIKMRQSLCVLTASQCHRQSCSEICCWHFCSCKRDNTLFY